MKTIEKANSNAVHAENLEDIIFESRNQKYGAYALRKNYNNHLFLSFLAVFIITSMIAGIPLLHSFNNPPVVKEPERKIIPDNPIYVYFDPVLPPEPPARSVTTSPVPTVNNNAPPVITDEPNIDEPLATTDDLFKQVNPIENQPVVIAQIPLPKGDAFDDPNTTFDKTQVTTQAMFKDGSVDNFRKWLAKNIYYPLDALDNDIKGTVILKFTIDKLGKICDITVIRGLHPLIDQAAITTLKTSPKWTAATIAGKPVKVSYYLPIAFNIQR
jgi:periplasmic protein TonB